MNLDLSMTSYRKKVAQLECLCRCLLLGDLLDSALLVELQPCIERIYQLPDTFSSQTTDNDTDSHQAYALALARTIASAADLLSPAELEKAFRDLAFMTGIEHADIALDEVVQQVR